MKVLIVEDEPPIASYIERHIRKILREKLKTIKIIYSLQKAIEYVNQHDIDFCILDLNLSGKDGFDLLKTMAAGSFFTIVISANTDRALEAFEYGILDFLPKPFDEKRLRTAIDKIFSMQENRNIFTKYIPCREKNDIILLTLEQIRFFKSSGPYVEVFLRNGSSALLDKRLEYLECILPSKFMRVHRSCIIDLGEIKSFGHTGGGIYRIITQNDETLPLSRSKYRKLNDMLQR
jgi:DNA-binding LytR/AlgR family response regulator